MARGRCISKFFDYEGPLFHHLHLDFESAQRVGKLGKPEAYYFPPQYNNYAGNFPHTYFGFDPDMTKEEVKKRLQNYTKSDIRITELSRAFRIELGTGWYTPARRYTCARILSNLRAAVEFGCELRL